MGELGRLDELVSAIGPLSRTGGKKQTQSRPVNGAE